MFLFRPLSLTDTFPYIRSNRLSEVWSVYVYKFLGFPRYEFLHFQTETPERLLLLIIYLFISSFPVILRYGVVYL